MESNSLIKSKSTFIGKTLCLMSVGLLITFIVGLFTNNYIMNISTTVIYGAMILELVMVITLVTRVAKMSTASVMFWFVVYSAVNGVTLSIVFFNGKSRSIW